MTTVIDEYFAALDKLKEKNIEPTLDRVALEANRVRGAIRRTTPRFKELVKQIDLAADAYSERKSESPEYKLQLQLGAVKDERDKYRAMYENLLSERVSMINKVQQLKDELVDARNLSATEKAKLKKQGKLLKLVK
jgi:hypothetical protein